MVTHCKWISHAKENHWNILRQTGEEKGCLSINEASLVWLAFASGRITHRSTVDNQRRVVLLKLSLGLREVSEVEIISGQPSDFPIRCIRRCCLNDVTPNQSASAGDPSEWSLVV